MRNRILILSLILVSLSLSCFSTTVLWNDISCYSDTDTGYCNISRGALEGFWTISIGFTVVGNEDKDGTFLLTGHSCDLLFSGNWLEAEKGSTVSIDSIVGQDSYFLQGMVAGEEPSGNNHPLTIAADTDFYLIFCSDTNYPNRDFIYGWCQLEINEDGLVVLKNSAFDLDGGPMIVGGGAYSIPEPSGGLLFILGTAALGLRRRARRVRPSREW